RGSIILRAKTHIEERDGGKESIIITEIPYQQNKATLVEKIALLIKEKRIEAISEIRDESDRQGMRVVLDLKKGELSEVVLNQLYKLTPLQRSYGIIFLSIVNNRPEILNLKQIIEHFLLHRRTVVYRRTVYDLRKAEERAHILEGLKVAISNLDEVVTLIKESDNPKDAKATLMERFELSEIQAQSILDMRLHRLTGLEREKIISEFEELSKQIAWYKQVLHDETLVMKIIKDEFLEIKEQYGDERRTEIIEAPDEILPEDLIPEEEMVVTVTHSGFIKRNPANLYRAQRRGGKGIRGIITIEEDFVSNLYLASTHDMFLFFTNQGKVFWRKVYEIPMAGRTARGKAIVNFLELAEGEKVAAILPVASFDVEEEHFIFMVTKLGRVKKTSLNEFRRPLRKGKIALRINEGDEIISAVITNGKNEILLISENGMSIRFDEQDVRPMGRVAAGVKGITLKPGDSVVGVEVLASNFSILAVTENGYGKRSSVDEYRLQKRGGKGIIAIKASERNGKIIGARQVVEEDEVMLIASSGKIIRINMENVRVIGRNTQGVRLINLEPGEKVVAMDMLATDEENGDEEPDEMGGVETS
ncbi:MAG: DNA gyrase C-terminal beta-propeller domain-containing protein, partial [Desulfobulbales bacterium]